MAAVSSTLEENVERRRKRVYVGALPPDFLRIPQITKQQQEAADQQAVMALNHKCTGGPPVQDTKGRLTITVAQANLVKNYGITWMDPYVRIRVGHCIYETQTNNNGGRDPHWDEVLQVLLPRGINSIYLEIYDECTFTADELIAWAHIPIPHSVMNGETVEDWYPLSGKQGEDKEGTISLVLSYVSGTQASKQCHRVRSPGAPPAMTAPSSIPTMFGTPQLGDVSVFSQMDPFTGSDSMQNIQQIEEMFPGMDKDMIKLIYESENGDKDATVDSLLRITSG